MIDSTVAIEIEKQLTELPEQIGKKSQEAIDARHEWQKAKLDYECKYQEITLSYKAKDAKSTQTDLKAQATCGSRQQRLDSILVESKYRKTMKELQKLRDDFDALKERSYNYRAELKILKG